MTTAFTARRRAEEFNSLVEGASTSDARYADLLELVGSLRAESPVAARPAFVGSLREQLMAEADVALAAAPHGDRLRVAPRRTPRERRLAVAIGGVAILGATTSMAVAAQSALPGDTLYPLKRALENAETGLHFDETDKGETMLANASGRLEEFETLSLELDGTRDDQIAPTLQAFADQAAQAAEEIIENGSDESIAELRTFTEESLALLAGLADQIPREARPAFIEAAQVLAQIDARAAQACPSCPGRLPQIPPFADTGIEDLIRLIDAPFTKTRAGSAASPARGETSASGKGSTSGEHDGSEKAEAPMASPEAPQAPEQPEGPDGHVIAAPPEDGGGEGGDGSAGQDEDPLGDLVENATNGSSTPTVAPGDVGDAVDDATDPLIP